MSYMLKDPVEIRQGHIIPKCETCNAEVPVTLESFKEAWKDSDASTKISWFCADCAANFK